MNKVYRTVFNETTNTWVAVAEISPAKGKKSRSEKSSGGIGLHLMAPVMVSGMLLSGYAMAAPELKNGTGTNAIIVNSNPVTSGSAAAGDDSIAIGTNAKVEGAAAVGQSSIAVGSNAKTKAQNNIAIGTGARTENGNTIAVGNAAHAKGQSDLAIGDGAKATQGQGTAVGVSASAEGAGASAYGYRTKATGYLSTAIGNQAESSGSSSVAVGKALASGPQAIAIGNDAKSTSTQTIAVGNAADAGRSQFGIAIGSGAKLNTDTAVTGKNTAIAIGYQAEATDLDANAFGRKANATGQTSLAIGAESASNGTSSIAVGSNTMAAARDGIAIGNKAATGAGDNNTAVGSYSEANVGWSTALGTRAYTNANGALAAGTMASAEGQRATAIGSFSFAEGLTSTALGYHTVATKDAVSGTAMGTGAVIDGKMSGAWAAAPHANPHQYDNAKRSIVGGEGNYAIGNENIVGNLTKNSVVFGNKIKIGAEGATLTSTNPAGQGNSIASRQEAVTYTNATALENAVAIGNSSKVTVSNGVALGSNSVANVDKEEEGSDPLNAVTNKQNSTWKATHAAVSVGNGTDVTRQITSVAAGKNDTDAVNVAQLKAAGFELSVSQTGGGISEDKTQPSNLSDKKVKNGETVTIDAGKNIKVTQTGKTISIATKDKVEFTEITLGDATNNTVLTSTADGLDVGGDKITNVAKGTADTDAVNVSQLKAAQAAAKTTATAGKNITVKPTTNSDGSTNYEIATKDDVAFSKTTVGNVVTDGATGKITGLTAGDVSVTSTDAVNGSQLHATNQNVANNAANIAKGINFGGTTGSNNYRLGDTINVKGDSNITSTTVAGGAQLALNPNLNVTSVTTTDADGNKTVTNGSGVTITPAASGKLVSLTTGGLNNGGNKITNVKAGEDDTDAVNVSQLKAAQAAAKTTATAGKNITVKPTTNSDGSTNYEIATKDDVAFSKTTVGNVVTDGATGKITGLTAGDVSVTSTDAVNGSQLHATNQNVANNAANIAKGINFGGTTGSNNYRLGDTINVKGDSNITSTTVAGGAQLALNPNLNVTSVTTTDADGNKTVTNGSGVTITPASGNLVSLTTGGLNNGGNKITNVAAGTAGTDAVNISQLNQALGAITGANTANFTALNNKVNEVAADAKAGTAAAMAVAGLPQAYLPGKSMMAVGGSVYRGESGYAIGYSTISDGGNWIVKGTATGNSRGHYGATAAVGYQW